jgi:predicted alpha/beta superfamily hydrolase
MRTLLCILALLFAMASSATAKPYAIPDTQILHLHSKQTGSDYDLYIATPPDARTSGKAYPVVYMLDADYSFALVRNIVRHFADRGDLPELILVAIAYPGAASNRDIYRRNRTRDYTPVYAPDGGYGAEFQRLSGGGPKFRGFLAKELFPFIERKLPAAKGDRAIIGHSYGGLFAAYVLLTEPQLFNRYIIVSPSLWYANHTAMTMTDGAAKSGLRPQARVFLAVGAAENQPQADRSMVDDLKEFAGKLKRLPGLHAHLQVFEGETHNSVFPGAVTRGLRVVFDRPEGGGPARPQVPSP